MDELISALEKLFEGTDNSYTEKTEECWIHSYFKDTEEAQIAEALCCKYLIAAGDCNWENIRELESYGYRVFAEEEDSFGWLIACVMKNGDKRRLIYG